MMIRVTRMKVNEKYTVTIQGSASDGRGVARIDGEVVFIPGAIPGEICSVQIEHIGRSAAFAKLLRVEQPSAHRITPDCPYYPACGGCRFRHMDYEMELELKRQRVLDALDRIGGCHLDALTITGATQTHEYRNKVQYPVQEQDGTPVAGFYAGGTHHVIPVAHCHIQPACADIIRTVILHWMEQHHIRAYEEMAGRGTVRHIYLRRGAVSGELLICISANCKRLPHSAELVAALCEAVPDVTTIVFTPNEKKGNTILGDTFQTLYGSGTIEDTLCGLRFQLSPAAFYQVNHDQAELLYEKALHYAGLTGTETVLDLYCGTGTITLCLARQAGHAIGVEVVASAIEDAKKNAVRNNLAEKTDFYCMDAGQAAQKLAAEGTTPDVIVVDPPRKGISGDVIDAIAAMAPERVVYVSCDPATLARDVKLLRERGFDLKAAEAVDLFPRCAHVESIVLLTKAHK